MQIYDEHVRSRYHIAGMTSNRHKNAAMIALLRDKARVSARLPFAFVPGVGLNTNLEPTLQE